MDPVIVRALLQYGGVGILALVGALVSKVLFDRLGKAHQAEVSQMSQTIEREREYRQQETKRADRLEQALDELNRAVRSGYVDAITRATAATTDASHAVALAMATVTRS